jgi:NitT/TauT family transport system substrate-binding protein
MHEAQHRAVRAGATGAAIVLLLTACGGSGEEGGNGGGGGDSNKIVVSMPVIPPNFVHIMPWVAQAQGFYEDFDVDVEIVSLDSGVTALRGAEAGSADIAAVPTPTLINAVGSGSDVKAFYTYSPGIEVSLVANEDIKSCEDLRGKRLAIDEVGGFADALFTQYYTSCGLTKDDLEYVSFPGAEDDALVNEQADVGLLHIDEALSILEEFPEAPLHNLVNLWEVVPDWHYAGYAAPQEIIDRKRDALVRFVAANIAAKEFMSDPDNKDAVLDVAEEQTGLSRDILSETFDIFLEDEIYPTDNGYPQQMVDFTAEQQVVVGNVEEAPSYESLVDPSIYEDALELVEQQ